MDTRVEGRPDVSVVPVGHGDREIGVYVVGSDRTAYVLRAHRLAVTS